MCVCVSNKIPPLVGSCIRLFREPVGSMVSVLGLQGTALRLWRTKVSSLEPGWIAYGDPSNYSNYSNHSNYSNYSKYSDLL